MIPFIQTADDLLFWWVTALVFVVLAWVFAIETVTYVRRRRARKERT